MTLVLSENSGRGEMVFQVMYRNGDFETCLEMCGDLVRVEAVCLEMVSKWGV